MRILVAEDDSVSTLVLSKALQRLGHEPVCTSNGAEAWQLYQHEPYVVVISDWMMPVMDGLELCDRIRHAGSDSYAYFVLLTARTQRDDRLHALSGEVDDFLTKPLDRLELAACLRTAERIVSWQRQLQDVNRLLLANVDAMAAQARELQLLRQQSEYLARHDSLTGVLNRRAWFEIAAERPLTAVAIFDVDHFKQVNDRFGHPAGDAVLRQVTGRLEAALGPRAALGRVGGEEFAVAFESPTAAARQLCDVAIAAIASQPLRLPNGSLIPVTVSGGLAGSPGNARRGDALISDLYEAADRALYRSKQTGRARLTVESSRAA